VIEPSSTRAVAVATILISRARSRSRRVRRRRRERQGPRDAQRQGPADQGSHPVDAVECSACRACRAPAIRCRVENEARAREVAAYRQGVMTQKRTTSAPASLESMFSALKTSRRSNIRWWSRPHASSSRRSSRRSTRSRPTTSRPACCIPASRHHRERRDARGASGAPIIGFNVRANAKAREIAERQKVALKYYDVIYDLSTRSAPAWRRARPRGVRTVVGRAEIRECSPPASTARRPVCWLPRASSASTQARITRDDVIIYQVRSPACVASRTMSPKCAPAGNARAFTQTSSTSSRATPRKPRGRVARTDAVIIRPLLRGRGRFVVRDQLR